MTILSYKQSVMYIVYCDKTNEKSRTKTDQSIKKTQSSKTACEVDNVFSSDQI